MQEEDIGNRQRSKTFACTSSETHDNSRCKFITVLLGNTCPDCCDGVDNERREVYRSTAVFNNDGHPEEHSHALQQGSAREEVGNLCNVGGEGWAWWAKKVHGDLDNCNGWASGQEVAHHHRQADEEGNVVAKARAPFERLAWSIIDILDDVPVQRVIGIT